VSDRRWSVLAVVVAVALGAACGSRVGYIGERPDTDGDGDTDVDTDVDVDADSDTDADADPGCDVPEELRVVFSDTAPGFVHSMLELPDGHYVLSASYGWSPDEDLFLWILDGRTLEMLSRQTVPFETMSLAYDARTGLLLGVAQSAMEATLVLYDLGAGWAFTEVGRRQICVDCFAARSRPVPGPSVVAVAAETSGGDMASVLLVPYEEGPVQETGFVHAEGPAVVGNAFGPVALYVSDGELLAQGLHWNGEVSGAPVWIEGPTVTGYEAMSHGSGFLVATAVDDGSGPRLGVDVLDGSLWATQSLTIADDPELVYELALARSQGTVALTWGEVLGSGRVGIHLAAFATEDLAVIQPPALITPPRSDPVSTYALRPAIAPHDGGYAVVWGGWEEISNYALYGMIVSCWSF